jgi:hypothetical protein
MLYKDYYQQIDKAKLTLEQTNVDEQVLEEHFKEYSE